MINKIMGNAVGTAKPRPDFNQENPGKPDYIKNRPINRLLPQISSDDENKTLKVKDGKWTVVPGQDLITPQMFGAKADGVTDDSEAIRAAIAVLNEKKTGTLYFPPGVYIHGDGATGEDGTGNSYPSYEKNNEIYPDVTKETADVGRDIRFYFEDFTNLNILGYGAEIRSNDGNGQTRNNAMFMFKNCVGVKIKGLKLDGRRQERGVVQKDYIPGPINDFLQCNITFSYGSRDILIEDVTSVNSVHDGISIGWECDNVKILNCVCDNAQRNGIAICGCKNVVIEGCQCNDNGVSGDGYRGIAPKCGIDIEGHVDYAPNVNVHVSNCSIERNDLGFSINKWCHNVTIEKCYFNENPHLSVTDDGTSSDLYIRDCTIINSRLYSSFTLIENNTIEQHYNGGPLTNGYSFDGSDTNNNLDAPHVCKNNVFKFIVDDESVIGSSSYMGLRLLNNMQFIGNRVIGAFSANNAFNPIMLRSKVCNDNVFERGFNTINGINVTQSPFGRISYSETYMLWNAGIEDYAIVMGAYRENNDFGDYDTYGSKDRNRELVTDTSIKKSYSFDGDQTNKVYRIPGTGHTKISAFYLGQEEEVIFSGWDYNRLQHILKHESESKDIPKGTKILTVYQQYPYIYLKIHVPYPIFTASREMEYYYGQYNDSFFDGEIMTDVTGTIDPPGNIAINMIRTYGDDTSRPTYGHLYTGTSFYDTYLEKHIYWNGSEWFDYEGNQVTKTIETDDGEIRVNNLCPFTIDGKKYYRTYGQEFGDWVKSKFNVLGLRAADVKNGSGNSLVVSADGSKTLYLFYDGKDTPLHTNDGVTELKSGGAYFFKDTPGVNPDYSHVPVFWNGTELVTTPIYNGEVEDV